MSLGGLWHLLTSPPALICWVLSLAFFFASQTWEFVTNTRFTSYVVTPGSTMATNSGTWGPEGGLTSRGQSLTLALEMPPLCPQVGPGAPACLGCRPTGVWLRVTRKGG